VKHYKVLVHEEIGGSIVVEAKNKNDAELKVDELINEHGLNKLFHHKEKGFEKYGGEYLYGERTTHQIEEIKS